MGRYDKEQQLMRDTTLKLLKQKFDLNKMKKLSIIFVLVAGIVFISCSDVKRNPGAIYMPDMAYSRAYETYAVPTLPSLQQMSSY